MGNWVQALFGFTGCKGGNGGNGGDRGKRREWGMDGKRYWDLSGVKVATEETVEIAGKCACGGLGASVIWIYRG